MDKMYLFNECDEDEIDGNQCLSGGSLMEY